MLKWGGMQGGGRYHNSVKTGIFKLLLNLFSIQAMTNDDDECRDYSSSCHFHLSVGDEQYSVWVPDSCLYFRTVLEESAGTTDDCLVAAFWLPPNAALDNLARNKNIFCYL